MTIRERLFLMQDMSYGDFHSKLMPNIPREKIIGVRVPVLRSLAKELFKSGEGLEFIKTLPHEFYEENNLHAFIVEQIKDFDTALYETKRFLPYIDNWATCDMFLPKVFKRNTDKILPEIFRWIESDRPYTVRYAIGLLMSLYLDDEFSVEYLRMVADVKSDEYYVNMMRAWYFATALFKQYDAALPYITESRLDTWTSNKAIQKAVESKRITPETKEYLKSFKRK